MLIGNRAEVKDFLFFEEYDGTQFFILNFVALMSWE